MSLDQFYQKISQVERQDLIQFIDHNQTEFTLKINNQFIKTNVNYIKNEKFFSFLKFHDYDFSNEPILCTFRYKEDIFVFSSYLNSTKVDYIIDIPDEIYQLQRRNDFRITVPMGFPHECKIVTLREALVDVTVELRDISMGGIQISLPAFKIELNLDDIIDIYLKTDKFEFNRLTTQVRHIKNIESQDTLLVGLKFTDLVGENSNDMRSLIMLLDRVSRGKN